MQISIQTNFAAFQAALRKAAGQVPFAAAKALNATALKVMDAERGVMARVFDRPTAYTLNSLRVISATKSSLEAAVLPKDAGGSGRSAQAWLSPNVAGGPRREKGVERALRASGILPAGMSVVPGAGAQLDVFGNWRRAHLSAVLVDMRLAGIKAVERRVGVAMAKDAARIKPRQSRYFVVPVQDGELEPGIYERRRSAFGTAVRPVAIFTKGIPRYRKRFPFRDVAIRVATKHFPVEFEKAFDAALKTALPKAQDARP